MRLWVDAIEEVTLVKLVEETVEELVEEIVDEEAAPEGEGTMETKNRPAAAPPIMTTMSSKRCMREPE
jgi:hypothetical protein